MLAQEALALTITCTEENPTCDDGPCDPAPIAEVVFDRFPDQLRHFKITSSEGTVVYQAQDCLIGEDNCRDLAPVTYNPLQHFVLVNVPNAHGDEDATVYFALSAADGWLGVISSWEAGSAFINKCVVIP